MLPHETADARPERAPDRHVSASGAAPEQQQVRDVGGDAHEESHCGSEERLGEGIRPDAGEQHRAPLPGPFLIDVGIQLGEGPRPGGDLRLCLLERRTGREAADEIQQPAH